MDKVLETKEDGLSNCELMTMHLVGQESYEKNYREILLICLHRHKAVKRKPYTLNIKFNFKMLYREII